MNEECKWHGFVVYYSDNTIYGSWYEDGKLNGNVAQFNASDLSIKKQMHYIDGDKEDDAQEDDDT